MITFITILGRGIRANLHRQAGDTLESVIGIVRDGLTEYGLTADLLGPAEILYAARPEQQELCGAEVYIRTLAQVELHSHPIQPPRGPMPHIHTNTHHAKANRRALREGTTMAFKPVLAMRQTKTGKAQLCMQITTRGPAQIIYAAPHSGISPMPCGAFVWLICPAGVDVMPANALDTTDTLIDQARDLLHAA